MATNPLAGVGLSFARNYLSGANTYQASQMLIKNAYATALPVGDPVGLLASPQGYVGVVNSNTAPTNLLGVFAGVRPYYDTTLQATSHGLNGEYVTTAAPPSGVDIPCLVITDAFATFIVQVSGSTGFLPAWVGNNCTWLASSIGAANSTGRSTLVVDGTTFATTAGLPLRVIGPAGVSGGPQDPANVNPWIEVRLNNNIALSTTGI